MMEPKFKETLLEFTQKFMFSNRKHLLSEVKACVNDTECPEVVVKAVAKVLAMNLQYVYQEHDTLSTIEHLLDTLCARWLSATCAALTLSFSEKIEYFKKTAYVCSSECKQAYLILKWTNMVLRKGHSNEEFMKSDDMMKMVRMHPILVHVVCVSSNSKLKKLCHKEVTQILNKHPGYLEVYKGVIKETNSPLFFFSFVGILLNHLTVIKDLTSADEIKVAYRDHYVESVLKSREKLNDITLNSCQSFLFYLTHEDFKSFVWPTVDRFMLRNPEITLSCLTKLIGGLSIDLSVYALDIGKHLAAQCISKEELQHALAVEGCLLLAKQCTDSSAINKLIDHLFKVLAGSEGKLSLVSQKVNVMSAIGNCSRMPFSGSSAEEIAASVLMQFINYLQTESAESAMAHAAVVMSQWTCKLSSSLPPQFVQWIDKLLVNKTSTSNFRSPVILCLSKLKVEALSRMTKCLPTIIQAFEKCIGQTFQVQLATEAIHAACLALRLIEIDFSLAPKCTSLWNALLDCDKQYFTSDKFLKCAPKEALVSLSDVSILLFTLQSGKLNDKHLSLYARALLLVAIRGDHECRKTILQKLKRMISSTDGFSYVFVLLTELSHVVASGKAFEQEQEEDEELMKGNIKSLYDIYLMLCQGSSDDEDSKRIARETLVQVHHPFISQTISGGWVKLLEKLQIEPKKFVEETSDLYESFRSSDITPSHMNALCTLARLAPTKTFEFLENEVSAIYSNPALLEVTSDEHVLLSWPEGELFDKSVREPKYEEKESNIKRENKLYSYKEQLLEMELKKELAKKNPVKEDLKLSKKQQEMVDEQLAKETNTRNKLKKMLSELEHANKLVESCMKGDAKYMRLNFHWLLPMLVRLFKSILAAPSVTKLFLKLEDIAFNNQHQSWPVSQGPLLSHCTLRLLKPKCALHQNWSEEPLEKQVERITNWIFAATQPKDKKLFHAPTFNFFFFFLQSVLQQKILPQVDLLKCLSIMSCHVKVNPDDSSVEANPLHLPRKEVIKLCMHVVGTEEGPMQDEARNCLQNICHACSGDRGCVRASGDEIDCLLEYVFSPLPVVRNAALESLMIISRVFDVSDLKSQKALKLLAILWMEKFDVVEDNKVAANQLFEGLPVPDCEQFVDLLAGFTVHHENCVREASSTALAEALSLNPQHVAQILNRLLEMYKEKLHIEPAVLDQFGRVLKEASPDNYPARCGITLALGKIAPLMDEKDVEIVFKFFISSGLVDRNKDVQSEMLNSALQVVNHHGQKNLDFLLETFQEFLKTAPKTGKYDFARQSVVILMGTLAKHLDEGHPVLKPIVLKLIDTLSTPSEQVQAAVANCLSPLVVPIKGDAPGLVKNLLTILLESDKYGERRGAAYGLAGFVKGLGILSLKQLDIITVLTEAIQNKKNLKHREGSLLAFELLCQTLGRLFEPYVVHLLPYLLLSFGDSIPQIRKAADETAKVVMSNLSAHGVKLVLPSLLNAIDNESSWRTKCGSIELLGAMAHCAPKQLSACLPNIVPKLLEVLTDSHVKVQTAGCQALKQIGSVIRNPEIQAVVPVLLEALQDPTKKTNAALQKLLDTKFVHFIDSPSLALIMPVVQRALTDRSTETRKIAAQIVGNMYSLTDQKDLSPYLPTLVPGLKQSLLSPMPEVRSASARAFGTMVRGMGEKGIEDLIPWLMQTLTSESSTVDRSGAAQGLSEVVGGLGLEKLNSLMPDIIQTANRVDIAPNVRDGYIMMYIYLPTVFGEDFIPYVGSVIPSVLKALADETEYVRDTALKAGQRIVNLYADTAIELLLPEVENGLFDDNWRIRFSSVQLLGDILFKISGVSGKMTTDGADEDDNFGSEISQKSILAVLGVERYNRVFAGLYICRQDTALQVRQSALHIWKMIVTHTPRTLKNIMSDLFHMLLGCLASQNPDKRQVAARTLGDIVKKLGEKVLPEIIPILEKGLDSDDCDQRQGVCIGLSEIMNATSRDHVILFADSLIPSMRKALCDPLPSVREAAAATFDILHSNLGARTLEDILPDLLKKLDDPVQSEYALDGLRQVMAVKSRVVLPYLIPQLIAPPVNARALCFLSSVAGDALAKHLSKILPAITASLALKLGTSEEDQEMQYCKSVVLSLHNDAAIRITMEAMIGGANNTELPPATRVAFLKLLHVFCEQSKADLTEFIPQLLRSLIHLAIETNEGIINTAWDCLNSVVKKLDSSAMIQYIGQIRQAIRFAVADLKGAYELPGFSIPKKGIIPLVVIFREGVLAGGAEAKESASVGLSEAIKRTGAEALKPSVINITGALIRILGDRYNYNVKAAMLDTLNLLLAKCGANLKPFLPQLQTTFMKAFNDINRGVRIKAAEALGKLVTIHNRIDSLFAELIALTKTSEDIGMRDTLIQGIRLCLVNPSCKINDKTQKELCQMLESFTASGADSTRLVAAACLGALCTCLDPDLLSATLNSSLLDCDSSLDWMLRYNKSTSLSIALKECPNKIISLGGDKIKKSLMTFSSADRIPISLSGLQGTAYFLHYQLLSGSPLDEDLMNLLAKSMKVESNDVKQLVAQIVSILGHSASLKGPDSALLKVLVPVVLNGSKDKSAIVKSFSEHALMSILQYRKDDTIYQMCMEMLEPVMKSTLSDVASKVLKKLSNQPDLPDEDIDTTLLK